MADTESDRRAESVAAESGQQADDMCGETTIAVEHTVMFHLGEADQFVVPRRDTRGYVLVDGITVHLRTGSHGGKSHQVWAGGIVCKKDGSFSNHWGRTGVTADLPDPDLWIKRAQRQVEHSLGRQGGQEDTLRRGGCDPASPGIPDPINDFTPEQQRLAQAYSNGWRDAMRQTHPPSEPPMRCDNCGKTMAEHGPAANCWGPGAGAYPLRGESDAD